MVQSVEIGVGQQRTDDRPLGGASFGRTPPFAGFHHTLLEHPSDQFQNGSIGNVLGDYGQEFILRYAIEIAFEVGVHHPDFPLLEELNDSPKRVFGSSPRPESVAVFGKEFLEDWFEHVAQRHFDDPIFDFGHTEGPHFFASQFGYPDPLHRLGLVLAALNLGLQWRQSLCALVGIAPAFASIRFLAAFTLRHLFHGSLQILHLPDFIHQTIPFASFDSSFEGCQHAFGPHDCFGPDPLGWDFSALFSHWHSRQFYLQLCFLHASTFLPPLAPRGLAASLLLRGL